MPELPEVETVRRAMDRHLVGHRITGLSISRARLRQPLPVDRLRGLAGAKVVAARRRAKYLLLELDTGSTLLIHLGMTGNLLFGPGGDEHDHVVFHLDRGPSLVYRDPRRFGLVLVLAPAELAASPHLAGLGPEPLEPGFDAAYLRRRCRDRDRPIKALLMDNGVVVGVGNIYASESLFRARIRPMTPAGRLGPRRLERLVAAIKEVLQAAIEAGGTTVSDYLGSGEGGGFQRELAVYGRAGEGCLVCDRPVESLVLSGRSTYFCRRCQR
jgi:formamidopyrimidine-DNA glycosylase